MADDLKSRVMISKELQYTLSLLQNKLEGEFSRFLVVVNDIYIKGIRSRVVTGPVYSIDSNTEEFFGKVDKTNNILIKQISSLLTPGEITTVGNIKNLVSNIDILGEAIVTIKESLKEGNPQGYKDFLESYKVDIDKLKEDLKIFKSRILKLGKPLGPLQKLKESTPNLFPTFSKGLGRFGEGVARSLPLGGIAWGLARNIGASIKSNREQGSAMEREKTAYAGISSGEKSPKSFSGIFNRLQASAIPEDYDAGSTNKKSTSLGNRLFGGMGGSGSLGNDALMNFFNRGAFKAKWTVALLEAVQGKMPKDEDGKNKDKWGAGWLGLLGKAIRGAVTLFIGMLRNPLAIAIASIATSIAWGLKDASNARNMSEKEGWLTGTPGKKQSDLQNKISSTSGFLAGGKGSFGNAIFNAGKGALLGGGTGALIGGGAALAALLASGPIGWSAIPALLSLTSGAAFAGMGTGALIGGGIGGGLGAIGSENLSKASYGILKNFDTNVNNNNQVPLDNSPLDTNTQFLEKISMTLSEIKDSSKTTSTPQTSMRSGYDAYNERNPMFSGLMHGVLDNQ